MRKRGIKLLVLVVLIGALSGGVWAAVTEGPAPQVQTVPPLVVAPAQPGKPAWMTPEKEAALVEVRKILKEARQVAEGIELPNRLTTSGMILKDLQAGKDALIKEIEKAQFRVGDFSTVASTKQPWYLVLAQVKYGWIDEAVAKAAQTKLDAGTLLVLIEMLADTGHLDAASKIAGANLAKEQVTDWRYRDEAVIFALLARELARAGDSRAKETLRRAMQAAQKVKLSDDRALAFMHVARAQAAIGDHTGSIESFRQTEREIPARSEMPVIVGRLQQIGKAQLEGGQRMEGEETLQRAIQLTAGLEPLPRAALLGCVAWTRFVTGDESNAGQLLERTVGESKGLSPAHQVKVLYDLGRWQLGLHQKEAALQTARLMKEAVEAIEEEKEKANALSMARNFAVQARQDSR